MADYFPLISRAVAGLSPNTKEQREAIYARAREALTRQLTSLDPPIPEADLWRERNALEETVRRVEAEYTPKVVSTVRPELKPDVAIQTPKPAPKPAATPQRAQETKPVRPEPEDAPRPAPVIVDPTDTDTAAAQSAAVPPPQAVRRPKVIAPHGKRLTGMRATIVAIVLPALLALGTVAYVLRDDPAMFDRKVEAPTGVDAVTGQRKSEGRLDGTSAGVASGTNPTAPGSRSGTGSSAALPVASRAVFFEETATDPRGVQSDGQVIWRSEQIGGSPGQPADIAIRGSVSFPTANMSLEFVINRNKDTKLPASHMLELAFRPEGTRDGVQEIGPVEARDQEAQPGYQLRGAMVPIGTNLFLIGLDSSPAVAERNQQAMRDERFFAFQFRLTSGKVGALLLEKGPTGDRVFREAFDLWNR